jgi:hypothetical protein
MTQEQVAEQISKIALNGLLRPEASPKKTALRVVKNK